VAAGERRTTIVDVGRVAGVSTKTVSRVLNGEPHVSEAIRQRVQEAAQSLNYYPNLMARALVRRRSHLIGLVYENPSPSYVVELQRGVLHRLKDGPYRLVVIPVPSVAEHSAEVVGLLRSAALDGVVLAPPAADDARILADLASAGIRCARIAPTVHLEVAPGNVMDDVAAAREIADYVIGLGHREIAIIKGDPTHASSEARMKGYAAAFRAAGLVVDQERIEQGMFTRDSGYLATQRLLAQDHLPTAILAQNDDMAVGALIAARERGLSVPDQLSIVGFDDSEVAQIAWPGITTVRQPVFEMAVAAADMVVAQLEGKELNALQEHGHELVIRGSAAAVPD
jgi:LacI family transcriptional regulator